MNKPDAPVERATTATDTNSKTDEVLARRIDRAFRKVQDNKDMSVFRLILSEYYRASRPRIR